MSTPIDDKLPSKRFGEKLRALRKKQGLTQVQLGEMVGVDHRHIGRLENSEKNPNVAMLLRLIQIFDVTTDVLIRDELNLEL